MSNDGIDKKRFNLIHHTLMEFASGYLASRVEQSDKNDEVEKLVLAINSTLENVSAYFYHFGFANHGENYNYNIQLFFLLNNDDSIVSFSPAVKKLLSFSDRKLNAKPFSSFLTKESQQDWHHLKPKLAHTSNEFISLSFKTKQKSIIIFNCLVDKAFGKSGSEGIMVTAIKLEKQSDKVKRELYTKVATIQNKVCIDKVAPKKHEIILKRGDIEKLEKTYFYIQKNLDKPLPPLKKLAKLAGTNEHRLKHGFRKLYGQSISGVFKPERSFLKNERLKKQLVKALLLVKNTNISISEIATATDYKFFSNFSTAFKKEFKQTPTAIRHKKHTHNDKGSA